MLKSASFSRHVAIGCFRRACVTIIVIYWGLFVLLAVHVVGVGLVEMGVWKIYHHALFGIWLLAGLTVLGPFTCDQLHEVEPWSEVWLESVASTPTGFSLRTETEVYYFRSTFPVVKTQNLFPWTLGFPYIDGFTAFEYLFRLTFFLLRQGSLFHSLLWQNVLVGKVFRGLSGVGPGLSSQFAAR